MKTLVTAASTNLILLGVPAETQLRAPSMDTFPQRFNQNLRGIWQRSVEYATDNITSVPVDKQWDIAVKHFIRECLEKGFNPFDFADQSGNGSLLNYLLQARRRVVKYIDEWRILERFPPFRNSETLSVELTEHGLVLRSAITLRRIKLRNIKEEFVMRRFFRFDGPYKLGKQDWRHRLITHPVWIGFSAANDFEGILWYEIHVHSVPHMKMLSNDLLFNHEERFERFVRQTIWNPISRTIRFSTMTKRISTF